MNDTQLIDDDLEWTEYDEGYEAGYDRGAMHGAYFAMIYTVMVSALTILFIYVTTQ